MYAQFNRFEIKMTKKEALSCTHPGPCDLDVEALFNKKHIKIQLAGIPSEKIAEELKEYGAWDEKELMNHNDNYRRILWIAAGNIAENMRG